MERPSNRSFKRRGNRITLAQETALTKNWATYGIPEETAINPREHFPNAKRLVMEIGTGMGEATALIARDFPEDGFFAVELHKPGLGALLARMGEYGISNIRLVEEDARVLLQYFFPKGELDAVHLYFPDPWPKNKHWKRRIVQEDFVELVAGALKSGGHIHIATDWVPYAEWIAEKFEASPSFTGGVVTKPDFRPLTRFEGQGLRKGHEVRDFIYTKI